MNKLLIHNIHSSTQKLSPNHVVQTKGFAQVLDTIVNNEVKFSKHATERLESRNIKLDNKEIHKLNDALNKANQKGIKETLILMNNKAFVASVKSKTIITVATDEQLKENVFTNIDGAVIL